MWNCRQQMAAASGRAEPACARLKPGEIADLRIYLENLPQTRRKDPDYVLRPAAEGRASFSAAGCARCHSGRAAPERRKDRLCPSAAAASLWNHPDAVLPVRQPVGRDEMSAISSYLWSLDGHGDSSKGARLAARRCAGCHGVSAPPLQSTAGETAAIPLLAALWNHGPEMQSALSRGHARWPFLSGRDMANLLAWLEEGAPLAPGRAGTQDVARQRRSR